MIIKLGKNALKLLDFFEVKVEFIEEKDLFKTDHYLKVIGKRDKVERWCRIFVSGALYRANPCLEYTPIYKTKYIPDNPLLFLGTVLHGDVPSYS